MRKVLGVTYGFIQDLGRIDEEKYILFPVFGSSGLIGYYFESIREEELFIETRLFLRPRINKGRIRDISVRSYIPTSDLHQRILDIDLSHSNMEIVNDSNDNLVMNYRQDVLPANRSEKLVVKEKVKLSQFKLRNFDDIELVKSSENMSQRYQFKREILDVVKTLSSESDLGTLINCLKFIKSRVKYVRNYFRLGALFALKHGKGACDEITDLCAAILEAMGFKVRVTIGYVLDGGFHAWLEVLAKKIGWIPIDATMGVIGCIGFRWIKIFSENKPNEKLFEVYAEPKRLSAKLEFYLDGEKLA